MAKLDPTLTKQLQDWLNCLPAERDIIAGANLLLKINRNRALYNTIIRRPERFADKLEYELKKFLRIRLDGLTQIEVAELEQKIIPSAQQIIDVANELPEAKKAKGRRPDHDLLPDNIKALWDQNFTYYKQINLLFEELKAMSHLQPCDRYDKLQMLAAADSKYRDNLAKYDDYVIGSEEPQEKRRLSTEDSKRMGAARKAISKIRARLSKPDKLTEDSKTSATMALQRHVNIVVELGGNFNDDTKQFLSYWGVKFD